jgi:Leucine-rich repeat (LRR) protein
MHSWQYDDTHVRSVEFYSSSLTHVPVELFKTFKNLQYLYVFNSKLKTVNKLSNCANLEYYHAYNNEITVLRQGSLSACRNLKQIHLYNNPIKRVEDGFFHKKSSGLEIRLHNCEIDEIQPTFLNGIENVSYLDLLKNKCIDMPLRNVNPTNAVGMKPYFYRCFQNFKNSGAIKRTLCSEICS